MRARVARRRALHLQAPKAEQQNREWQVAAELLMLIGERGGDPVMTRIGVMNALQRNEPRSESTPRRKRPKA